jgi:hypothetical protein
LSLAAGEALPGSAPTARRWLLLEVGGAWGRDVVADTDLDERVRDRLERWLAEEAGSRVLFLRRPDRRHAGVTVLLARSDEDGGELRRLPFRSLAELADAALDDGDRLAGPVLLVCVHGRRDPCCARHGVPLFEALSAHVAGELLWQSSHHGGHRFAANLLVLPAGISLGRVPPAAAATVAAEVGADRIPLAFFRGRTVHPPPAQAAEAAVREELGLRELRDVRVLECDPPRVVLQTPNGVLEAVVEAEAGPSRPESCGADPAPTTRFRVRW